MKEEWTALEEWTVFGPRRSAPVPMRICVSVLKKWERHLLAQLGCPWEGVLGERLAAAVEGPVEEREGGFCCLWPREDERGLHSLVAGILRDFTLPPEVFTIEIRPLTKPPEPVDGGEMFERFFHKR